MSDQPCWCPDGVPTDHDPTHPCPTRDYWLSVDDSELDPDTTSATLEGPA